MYSKILLITYFMSFLSYEVKADNPWDPRKGVTSLADVNKDTYAKIALSHNFGISSKFDNFEKSDNSIFDTGEVAIGRDNLFKKDFKETNLCAEFSLSHSNRRMTKKSTKNSVTERYKKSLNSSQNSLIQDKDQINLDQESNNKEIKVDTNQNQTAHGEVGYDKAPYSTSHQTHNTGNKMGVDQRSGHAQTKKDNGHNVGHKKSKNYVVDKEKTDTVQIKKALNVKTTTFMVKGYWEARKSGQIVPFIGGGIGIAHHDLSGDITKSTNIVNPIWGIEGGLSISVTPRVKVDLSYDYTDLGKVKLDNTYLPIRSHQAKIGLCYYF